MFHINNCRRPYSVQTKETGHYILLNTGSQTEDGCP